MSVHADDRAYKPLNWMSPPCWLTEAAVPDGTAAEAYWVVTNKAGEELRITIASIEHDSNHELGIDRVWSRTASRHICRNCSPNTWRRWEPATPSFAAST